MLREWSSPIWLHCRLPALLPRLQVGAIKRLRAGVVDKVFLEFEQPGGSASAAAGSAAAGNTSDGSSSKRGAATDAGVPGGASWGDSEPAVSYALLWSCPWEAEDGTSSGAGAAAASASLAGATAAGCEACVPDWAQGIFSLRFGGPEFKHAGRTASSKGQQQTDAAQRSQAADQAAAGGTAATGDGAAAREAGEEAPEDAEFSPCAEAAQPTCYQAVAWVTGEAALAMEAAPDEEVLGVLRQLGDIFPQLQLPPGASWDRVTLRRWACCHLPRPSAELSVAALSHGCSWGCFTFCWQTVSSCRCSQCWRREPLLLAVVKLRAGVVQLVLRPVAFAEALTHASVLAEVPSNSPPPPPPTPLAPCPPCAHAGRGGALTHSSGGPTPTWDPTARPLMWPRLPPPCTPAAAPAAAALVAAMPAVPP